MIIDNNRGRDKNRGRKGTSRDKIVRSHRSALGAAGRIRFVSSVLRSERSVADPTMEIRMVNRRSTLMTQRETREKRASVQGYFPSARRRADRDVASDEDFPLGEFSPRGSRFRRIAVPFPHPLPS